jgi:hypothetical protein
VSSPRRALVSGLALAVCILVLAACGSGHSKSSSTITKTVTAAPSTPLSSSNSSPASPSVTDSVPTGPATSTATTPVSDKQACATAQLTLSAGDSNGAAGSSYDHYLLVNKGPTSCTLTGFPGVSFLNSAGTMLGQAGRSTTTFTTVTLPVGQTASFMVKTSNIGVDAGCSAATQTTATLQVYPPNQTTVLTVPSRQAACQPVVGPVQLGTQATP